MAVCLVCGRFDDIGMKKAMTDGWVFTRCPECHRGIPLDLLTVHLSKSIPEN